MAHGDKIDRRKVNKKNHIDYDGKDYYIRDGIVIVEKNAQIRSGTVI